MTDNTVMACVVQMQQKEDAPKNGCHGYRIKKIIRGATGDLILQE